MLRVFIPVVAFFVSFTVSGQKFLDFYFGYNMPVLKKITDHFIAVNNDYQQSYPDQGEFALSATGTGYFRGLRMNFGDDFGNGIPISLEYNYYRKRIYSNKAYFPDRNMIGQYRMRYGCHSVGFVFGGVGSFLRFGIHYNFGNVHWQKKFYPRDEFENGKWVNNVEIIELLYWKGPIHDGLILSLICRWRFLEIRPYFMITFEEFRYPDYTHMRDYALPMSNFGFTACIVFTRFKKS